MILRNFFFPDNLQRSVLTFWMRNELPYNSNLSLSEFWDFSQTVFLL